MDDDAGKYVMKETWPAIDKIPDDILMSDWYYSLSPDTEKHQKSSPDLSRRNSVRPRSKNLR